MIEKHTFRDDVFFLLPACGLWLRERHSGPPAASVLIGWGYWGIEIRFIDRPATRLDRQEDAR